MVPNRIVLISRGRHEEYTANSGNILPGHILQRTVGAAKTVDIHSVSGGGAAGGLMVAEEDALRGGTINGYYSNDTASYSNYASGSVVMVREAAKGDKLLCRLASGQSVSEGTALMSNGDGTLVASTAVTPSSKLYEIVAPSSTITNTGTETAFSNGSYTFPANFFLVGDVIHVRFKAFLIAVNSTNTHRIRMYLGSAPLTLADSTALALIANDVVIVDMYLTIRTITSSGTIIGDGTLASSISGTFTTEDFTFASATLDSTVAETLVIKSLASAASTGNQIRLDEFYIELDRAGAGTSLLTADEAVNNTGGTTPFIRCIVN